MRSPLLAVVFILMMLTRVDASPVLGPFLPPTVNERIVESGFAALRNEVSLPLAPEYCLTLVRLVLEDALGLEPLGLYARWRTHITPRPAGDDYAPWARDMERSLRAAGMEVPMPRGGGPGADVDRYVVLDLALLQPGDLLFRWDSPDPRGHVGILMPGGLVLENASVRNRPDALARGSTVLSPLGTWPVTTVIRFDPTRP